MDLGGEITLGEVYRKLGEVHDDVRRQNGRVRTLETKVAVLEDRSEQTKTDGRNHGALWGSIGGAVIGGALWFWQQVGGPK